MDAQINPDVVGRDFDRWLDWNGTADETQTSRADAATLTGSRRPSVQTSYPITPSSTAHSDSCLSANQHTAPSSTGPLTPTNSSGSPELVSTSGLGASGDILHCDDSIYRPVNLKRKLSSEAPDVRTRPTAAKPGASKRPHNVIEKRYRANLNEKIAELRDSVPSLRAAQQARDREDGSNSSGEEHIEAAGQGGKLNKASILSKAVEYIRHLEYRNTRLEDENRALTERLQTLDKVIAQGGDDAQRVAAFTSKNLIEESPKDRHQPSKVKQEESQHPSQGLVPVPQSWKDLRQNGSQDHYGHVYQNTGERSRFAGKWPTRVMLGSLAGLMIIEGFVESEHGTQSKEKGLFGIPLELLDGWTFLKSPRLYLTLFAEYCRAGGVFPLVKGFMALSVFAFFIFAYLFNSKPHPEKDQEKNPQGMLEPVRPASPIQVRRRAWSTSMQALNLPHHSFFPEWLALTSEWIKYTVQYFIGCHAYAYLTGRSVEDEAARTKAWDIALDAQLAGGDTEISRSRVVLTIYGAGTLPQTPLRLMQKALHCRVLLWNVGVSGTTTARLANYVATFFANRQWRRARLLHERLSPRDTDRLPGYLNYLLQMDCDDVFNEAVTQRATNLMYNRPTSEYVEDILMDVVVEDHAIRSPLDAIAAWRSTCALHEALNAALQTPDSTDLLREHIQAALEIAPPGSAAETRALAVHAILSPGRRHDFYMRAMDAITTPAVKDATVPYFIDSSTPASARPDIAICLHCAKVMLTLEQERNLQKAVDLLVLAPGLIGTSVLSTASIFFVLWRIQRAEGSNPKIADCSAIAAQLYKTCRTTNSGKGLDDRKFSNALGFLSSTWESALSPPSRRYSMVSNDTGYVSLSEGEHEHKFTPGLNLSRSNSNLFMTMAN